MKKSKRFYRKGKDHHRYKLERHKKYYCKEFRCNNEITYNTYKYGGGRCEKCAYKGKLSSQYKHGKYCRNNFCIDCDKRISFLAKRCQSCGTQKWIKIKGHPFKGKHHSIETKLKISKSRSGPKYSGKNHWMFGKSCTHGKKIKYKRIWMRSSWEAKFAQFLTLSGYKWQYESKRFNLDDMTYLPDFYLPDFDCYIEIKGYWRDNAKKRFNLFKKLYHNIKIKLFMRKELQELGIID